MACRLISAKPISELMTGSLLLDGPIGTNFCVYLIKIQCAPDIMRSIFSTFLTTGSV